MSWSKPFEMPIRKRLAKTNIGSKPEKTSPRQSEIDAAILSGVQKGLRIMGNSGGASSVHYWELKSKKTLEDLPYCFEDFAEFLLHLFGAGGAVILKNIQSTMVEELEKVVIIPKGLKSNSDCVEIVAYARDN